MTLPSPRASHRPGYPVKSSACYAILLGVSFLPLLLNYILHFHSDEDYTPILLSTSQTRHLRLEGEKPNNVLSDKHICSHARRLYQSNHTALVELERDTIREANLFHAYGGSLKSIQQFLDRQIQPTLKRLDVSYREKNQKVPPPDSSVHIDEFLHDYYAQHPIERGGYGQPLPIEFYDSNEETTSKSIVDKALHGGGREGKRWIDVLEEATPERFQAAVGPMAPPCPHMIHFSENKGLEEKCFCVENDVAADFEDDACHIFSIGSNDQWNFETSLRQKQPQCHTHTFDCTLNGAPRHQPKNDDKVHFYPYCVSGGQDSSTAEAKVGLGERKYLPYLDLWKATSIQHPPKLLKMDVEGFEFDVLTSMLQSFDSSDYWPEQIMMEVHYITRMVDLPWMLRTRQAAELALFFDTLWNAGGYLPIKVQYFGEWCPSCMEILLLRVRC